MYQEEMGCITEDEAEEALDVLNNQEQNKIYEVDCDTILIIKKSLALHIPKLVTQDSCPTCQQELSKFTSLKHCDACGQRIRWS